MGIYTDSIKARWALHKKQSEELNFARKHRKELKVAYEYLLEKNLLLLNMFKHYKYDKVKIYENYGDVEVYQRAKIDEEIDDLNEFDSKINRALLPPHRLRLIAVRVYHVYLTSLIRYYKEEINKNEIDYKFFEDYLESIKHLTKRFY